MKKKLLLGVCCSLLIILCNSCDAYMASMYGGWNPYMGMGYGGVSSSSYMPTPDQVSRGPQEAVEWAKRQIDANIQSTSNNGTVYSVPVTTTSSGSYGNSNTSSGNSSSSSSKSSYTPDCHSCHGTGKCWTCNGEHKYINPLTGKYVTCPNCRPGGVCTVCGGTGKKR